MTWTRLSTPKANWLVDARELRPGVQEVRSFVGLCSYYRRFLRGFATIAAPLHDLTRKGRAFSWTRNCQDAFEELKKCLTSQPVVGIFRNEGELYLDTDANNEGLGAVLSQKQDGEIRVLAYASRTLTQPERRYNTTRKELLAVVYGLKQFKQYLLGPQFVLRTDHAALRSWRRTPEPRGQQGRWLDLIEQFTFTIQHRAGTSHGNADSLSRKPEAITLSHDEVVETSVQERNVNATAERYNRQSSESTLVVSNTLETADTGSREPTFDIDSSDEKGDEPISFANRTDSGTDNRPVSLDFSLWNAVDLSKAQRDDPELNLLMDKLQTSSDRPSWERVAAESTATKAYWAQ